MSQLQPSLPQHARVVVIGGGIIGTSLAYHLAHAGWKDVVLLERDKVTSGTTWHAAGLMVTFGSFSETSTEMRKYTRDLYSRLEAETGQATGFKPVGFIEVAGDADRLEEYRRVSAFNRYCGVDVQEISPKEIQSMFPIARTDDLLAGFYVAGDGRVNPVDVTMALGRGARMQGVTVLEETPVLDVLVRNGAVVGVRTAAGDIACEVVVNCTGMWARQLGAKSGVSVPLQSAEHYYLITEKIPGISQDWPVLEDPASYGYYREEVGGLMVGLFEAECAPWKIGGVPQDFSFGEITPDWERVSPVIEQAMSRVPVLLETPIRLLFCGPESFTPDHNYLMGEAPDLGNFFVAAGFNSLGILSGGGVGQVMARWIVDGHPPMDVWSVNLRRTHAWQDNSRYLADRIVESLGIGYQDHWPARQWSTAREVRKTVLHDRVAAAGACFGEGAGWERPNWYAGRGETPQYRYGWDRDNNWFEPSAREHRAVRETVGLFEQSSFSKLLVQGRDALKVLNPLSTANLDVPAGRCVYTQFLNERGGIEADLTVTRLAADRFLVLTAAFTQTHVESWIRNRIPDGAFAVLTDISQAYAMLNVQGPNARALLQALSEDDLSHAAFPFGAAREIRLGYQTVLAIRLTYVGELGFELYVPTGFALPVYDAIVAEGARHGLAHCGYHALNSLRIEKAYREWAHDIGPDDSPLVSGLQFTCAWDKAGGFLGLEALRREQTLGVAKRRLVQFLLEDPDAFVYHNEPIFRDGEQVGFVTSAGYGHTLGGCVAMGYVGHAAGASDDFVQSGRYEIQLPRRRCPARPSLRPLYDPGNLRIRR